jgi:hypothetical protein
LLVKDMTIVRNERATLKFEEGSIVVARAFEFNGVYHDIVVSDGDYNFDKNHLKGAQGQALRKTIQDIFFQSIQRALGPDTALNAPLENVRFVYKKNQSSTETDNVQMFVHKPDVDSEPAPFQIGTSEINRSVLELSKIFSAHGLVEKAKGSSTSNSTSNPTQLADPSRATESPSLIPAPPRGGPTASHSVAPGGVVGRTPAIQWPAWIMGNSASSGPDLVVPAPPRLNRGPSLEAEADAQPPGAKRKSWSEWYQGLGQWQKQAVKARVGAYFVNRLKRLAPSFNGGPMRDAFADAPS